MKKKITIAMIANILLKVLYYLLLVALYYGALIIVLLHFAVSFFPILFIFDVYFCFGLSLPLKYIFKKKWQDCVNDSYLSIKYIFLPWLVMELLVMLCYPHETMMIIKSF